ncbi:MAG: CocE/NonD family hydrolase, partial [Gemmatimonadetes bacterium]|nr:CocE/NonD family hydrolase [Gemmatimonadota bacterium]
MTITSRKTIAASVGLVAILARGAPLGAQQRTFSEYPITIEYDVKVPMRDGVKLSVDVYRPADDAKHPTIFGLTPYNNLGDNTMEAAWRYVRRGYAYVAADVRGRFDSEGEFTPYRNDGKDGSDIISWIAQQPWSDTKVATTGGSYGGKNQWMIAKESNPHHVAMLPTVAPADEFHDGVRYNGVPKLDLMYTWSMGMDGHEAQPRQGWNWAAAMRYLPLVSLDSVVGRVVPWWRELMTHDALDDFWDPVQIRGHYEQFSIPSFNVSGWWDGQLRGALQGYTNAVRTGRNPADHVMIIGPWPHGVNRTREWGELDYGPNAVIQLDRMRDEWLDSRMLGKPRPDQANVMYFLPGKNEWRKATAFPIPQTQFVQYYLDSQGRANTLAGNGILKTGTPGVGQPDEFVSDPANPVPTISSRTSGARGGLKTGAADHRALETRPDVLVYTSEPLREGVEVTGPVKATI